MEKTLLTRRNMITAAAGGTACAVAFAAPIGRGIADVAETFEQAFTSPYSSLETGDHVSWGEKRGQTFTTPAGHALQVLDLILFVPFGQRIPGVTRTRAFAVDFQLVAGGDLQVETIQPILDPDQKELPLFLSAVGNTPGRVRAIFN